MRDYLVLSLIGADRTGLVDGITKAILKARGNVEDSRMAVLGGEFAMLVLVAVDGDARAALEREVREAADGLGLILTVKPTTARRPTTARPVAVKVHGMDHEGIVHDVVHYLAEQGISVERLDSQISFAPHTGTPLFTMTLRLEVPPAVSTTFLKSGLDAVGDRLNVTIDLEEMASTALR